MGDENNRPAGPAKSCETLRKLTAFRPGSLNGIAVSALPYGTIAELRHGSAPGERHARNVAVVLDQGCGAHAATGLHPARPGTDMNARSTSRGIARHQPGSDGWSPGNRAFVETGSKKLQVSLSDVILGGSSGDDGHTVFARDAEFRLGAGVQGMKCSTSGSARLSTPCPTTSDQLNKFQASDLESDDLTASAAGIKHP